MPESNFHIIIIGAGISGLLLAQGLKSAGISYSIFESDSAQSNRTREWSVTVHHAAEDLQSLLPAHLHARLREAYTDPYHIRHDLEGTPLYNSQTGERLHLVPRPDTLYLSRKKMRALCSEQIEVSFGMKLTGVSYEGDQVLAKFEDGTAVQGDLLIGADGPKSAVRGVLLGADKAKNVRAELNVTTAVVRYDDADVAKRVRSLDSHMAFGYHPDGMFNMIQTFNIPDPNDPTTWEFYVAHSVLGDSPRVLDKATILKNVKEYCEKLAEPFRSSIMDIPDSAAVFNDNFYYWIPVPWDNHGGKVTLAGDAAHPMPPYRGQGLGQSIRDVALLIKSLKNTGNGDIKANLPNIIHQYEEEMIPRGKQEVEVSLQAMYMVHNWEKVMNSPIMKIGHQKASEARSE